MKSTRRQQVEEDAKQYLAQPPKPSFWSGFPMFVVLLCIFIVFLWVLFHVVKGDL